MWKKILEFSSKLIALARRVEKLEESNTEIKAELARLSQKVDRLADAVNFLAHEFQRDRDKAEAERDKAEADRRILLLEIENRFLRFERGLPPSKSQDETAS